MSDPMFEPDENQYHEPYQSSIDLNFIVETNSSNILNQILREKIQIISQKVNFNFEQNFIEILQYESKSTIINILGTMENLHNENEKLTAEMKTILKFIKIHKKYKKKSNCILL